MNKISYQDILFHTGNIANILYHQYFILLLSYIANILFYNYNRSITFSNCESPYCTPVTYITYYSPPDSSVHGILQARLQQVAVHFSRRSPQPRNRTHDSYISCTDMPVIYHQRHLRSSLSSKSTDFFLPLSPLFLINHLKRKSPLHLTGSSSQEMILFSVDHPSI